jgi:hypothetical protein
MIAREKSSQSSRIQFGALRDDKQAKGNVYMQSRSIERATQYKNRQVCLKEVS